jgi:hypothetical protein
MALSPSLNAEYILTYAALPSIGLLINTQTQRIRAHAPAARLEVK